jgi:hypothetical protein
MAQRGEREQGIRCRVSSVQCRRVHTWTIDPRRP